MNCPNCNHHNSGGKFCEKCGTNLTTGAQNESAATVEFTAAPTQTANGSTATNQYLETTKAISRQYIKFVLEVLKKPFSTSTQVGGEQFINAIITVCLFSLFVPLMSYFVLKGIISDMGNFGGGLFGNAVREITPPFGSVVIKPFFGFIVFVLLISAFTFAAVKLGKVNATFKEVASRFGTLLVPFTALMLVAVLFSLLKISFAFVLLIISLIGLIFLVPALVISSYKSPFNNGLDIAYGSLLTYVLTFITLMIMGEFLFDAIASGLEEYMDIFGL
ncbi:zinc ribbon domain-containing protein [Neobacillus sp. YIM B06451]|uniref:zinc ribbon domain-containing protein n=1 Tax=Neobacillus sp. YIM B06451 TaxID=3070994 RepID=UPI002931CEE0|nr:zinc ribbon domain-containing protein [Neobacillus sp. YIM B06451]